MNYFKNENNQCIGAVIAVPVSPTEVMLYVAWENELMAKNGAFKCYKSREPLDTDNLYSEGTLKEVMNYGYKCTDEEVKKYFSFLL